MKKLTLVATAMMGLLSATGAMAQSTVTLYGILDGGLNHITGLQNGSATRIDSGIMDGSRFGLRGTEDIGGGYKAIFTLENRLELDTGSVSNRPPSGAQLPDRMSSAAGLGLTGAAAAVAPLVIPTVNAVIADSLGVNVGPTGNRLFDRQAFVGLVTPVGALTLGRQYTPGYLVGATFDASQTQSSLAAGQVASFPPSIDIRLSNTIQYAIQTSGITATLMYGAGEVAGQGSSAGRFFGGMVMYKGDGFAVGYGRNQRNNELGQKSLENNVFGGSVDVGPGTLYGQYATIKDENPTNLSTIGTQVGSSPALIARLGAAGAAAVGAAFQNAYNNAFQQDAYLAHIGYKLTSGVHTWVVAYNRLKDKRPNNASTNSYGATYTYALSKRTNLNAVLTRFNNQGTGQAAPGEAGFLGGVTSAAGVGSTNVAFGINHKF
ncbi:porin [Polaromonas jejuensis]|uniref:Porin n=1 Tax=Polaromonas jejuensis TaxID=457502 RepID=A0ABW0QF30_9BURK|nr:porin [Polaromonas jejuensis]